MQVGTIQITNTANGATHAITLSGFTAAPKLLLVWLSGRTEAVDTIGRASHDFGFGIATDEGAGLVARTANGGQGTDAATSGQNDTRAAASELVVLMTHAASSAADGSIDISAADATEIELQNTSALGHAVTLSYLALGGDIQVETGTITEPLGTGAQSINTTLVPEPHSLVLFLNSGLTSATATSAAYMFGLGFATGLAAAPKQYSLVMASRDGNTSMTASNYGRTDECIAAMRGVYNLFSRAAFTGFRTSGTPGFDLNWISVQGTTQRLIDYVLIKGVKAHVDSFATVPNPAGSTIAESGFGFVPLVTFCGSHNNVESTAGTLQASQGLSFGAATGPSNRNAQLARDRDGVGTSEVTTGIEFDAVQLATGNASTLLVATDIDSFDGDGITWIMDVTDGGVARVIGYFALGAAPLEDSQELPPMPSVPAQREIGVWAA